VYSEKKFKKLGNYLEKKIGEMFKRNKRVKRSDTRRFKPSVKGSHPK
jgi:hypothetical protein